jgi:hypothetical protein
MRLARLSAALVLAAALPGALHASDPVTSECAFVVVPEAGIPGYNDETLHAPSAAHCMNACSGREWCWSADYERATGTCYLQPVDYYDVPLRYDYPGHPYDHFTCEERLQG